MRPSVSSLLVKKPSLRSRMLLWLIALFVVVFIVWAFFAEVDELARGQGKVIPSKQLQLVQNLEGGIVSEILVGEGMKVSKGQVLLKMDDTQFGSSFKEKSLRLLQLQATSARLRAEGEGGVYLSFPEIEDPAFAALKKEELDLFMRRQAQLKASNAVFKQQVLQKRQSLARAKASLTEAREALSLAEKEVSILEPLLAEGVVSEVEVLHARKQLVSAQSEVARAELIIPETSAAIEELQSKERVAIEDFKSEAQAQLTEILAELSRLEESSDALQDRVDRTLIRSPVSGTVKQLFINTVGGVVKPGMDLISIVPDEDVLLIEARVRPSDIARLYPGQNARVKFTAYDFAIFGGLDAELVHISADTIADDQGESFYLVRVKTDKTYLGSDVQRLPILAGMVAEVDILTGRRTILDYLLKPIFKARDRALTEP